MQVSGVLLAAGRSTRMLGTGAKQLLPFAGEPLVRRMARIALAADLHEVIVVLGHQAIDVRAALGDLPVRFVFNPDYAEGQSTSVKAGLAALSPQAQAALFIPVDQPFLTTAVINQIVATYRSTRRPIVLPVYRGRRGAPVLFDRSLFAELAQITGDEGGRQVLQHHRDEIEPVLLNSEKPLLDIDTPEAYHALQKICDTCN